jgi:hypothetical protein
MRSSIYIGYDPRPVEALSFAVARHSIRRRLNQPIPIAGLQLKGLQQAGLYVRDIELREGRLWDTISNAPMAPEFSISRFLVPYIARDGWALFVDADVMARVSLTQLFACGDPSKACMVVKHAAYRPASELKMDGQVQTAYARKNWSSVVLWNCDHSSTRRLTPEMVNVRPGLWLHQFSWLDDEEIGELDPCWNHLVGEVMPRPDAKLVHFTQGTPCIPEYQHCEFADEWTSELRMWAA